MSEYTNEKKEYDFDGLAEPSKGGNRKFREFKNKSVMASVWIDDLVANGYGEKKGRKVVDGLFMSDEMRDVGVLSVAPAISALLYEIARLHDEGKTKTGGKSFKQVLTENDSRVLNVVVSSIRRLISECYPNGVSGRLDRALLSSMPFYDESSVWEKDGYLDSASWVFLAADSIESFLTRLEKSVPEVYESLVDDFSLDKNKTSEILGVREVKAAIRALYLNTLKVACNCIVRNDEGEVLGWSFKNMHNQAEPSLYFSYVASTFYLGLYKRFSGEDDRIDKYREFESLLEKKDISVKVFKFYEGITDENRRARTVERLKNYGFTDFADYISKISNEEAEEIDLLYNKINNGQPLTYKIDEKAENCWFTELKNASLEFSDTLWEKGFGKSANKKPFKLNMAKGPCFEDGSLVDMDVIRLSSHNNAFFNNLFVIGIILNSAYDYDVKIKKGEKEYNEMLNIFQLAIQNTQRCYNEIASEGLLYKIDSYILDFSERVNEENAELAKQLRKVNIAAVPLMPLILKNNNLMSQYVVKYPQKQMTESLKDIIANKKRKGDKSYWVWDKDGYNAITNYYYVDALISFYRYYEVYEAPFIANEDRISSAVKEAEERAEIERLKQLADKEKEYAAKLAVKDKYISEVRQISKAVARFVVNGLIDLVDEQLTSANLIGNLDSTELRDTSKVIEKLNSFNDDYDVVKLSTLIRLMEKLQIMSLLTMGQDEDVKTLIRNGNDNNNENFKAIIEMVYGKQGDASNYLKKMVAYLAGKADAVIPDTNNKQ